MTDPTTDPTAGPTRLCAACAHLVSHTPMMCALHRDPETDHARLCQPLRGALGACGPEGAFWTARADEPAVVVAFPQAHRVSA